MQQCWAHPGVCYKHCLYTAIAALQLASNLRCACAEHSTVTPASVHSLAERTGSGCMWVTAVGGMPDNIDQSPVLGQCVDLDICMHVYRLQLLASDKALGLSLVKSQES